jgi:hypothetical protein
MIQAVYLFVIGTKGFRFRTGLFTLSCKLYWHQSRRGSVCFFAPHCPDNRGLEIDRSGTQQWLTEKMERRNTCKTRKGLRMQHSKRSAAKSKEQPPTTRRHNKMMKMSVIELAGSGSGSVSNKGKGLTFDSCCWSIPTPKLQLYDLNNLERFS